MFVPLNFALDEGIDKVRYNDTVQPNVDYSAIAASDSESIDGASSLSASPVAVDGDGLAAGASGGPGGATSSGSKASFAEGAYFFSNMFKSVTHNALSNMLHGDRALANDVPLWGAVKDAINCSMRSCMSAPDGSFIAWYPDYWGLVDDTPYLELEDIELIDLTITHSDSEFYSHVYSPLLFVNVNLRFSPKRTILPLRSVRSRLCAATARSRAASAPSGRPAGPLCARKSPCPW